MRAGCFVCLVFVAITLPACSALDASIARVEHGLAPEIRVAGERGWSIPERLRHYHTPAVSVAVIHDQRIYWARAWGVADRTTGARVDASTHFQAASISKMITALAALRQVDAGRVPLDANINAALRSWQLPDNALTHARPVTLAMLLSHTAGTNVHSVMGYAPDAPRPTLRQVLDGAAPAKTPAVRVEHPPGEAFHYSGGGSLLVQQLIVDLAAQSFDRAIDELVFRPLGLTHSSFAVPPPPAWRKASVVAHDFDGTVIDDIVYPESAAAGLWTTPTDLARVLLEVQRARRGESKFLSRASAQQMTTPRAPVGPPEVWTGLGTFVEKHGDAFYFGHDGHNDGYLSVSRATVEGGDGVVIMTNGATSVGLILEIMRSVANEYRWPGWSDRPITPRTVTAAELVPLVGRYTKGFDDSVAITVDTKTTRSRLWAQEPFADAVELVPVGPHEFVSRDDGARVVFRNNAMIRTPKAGGAATTATRRLDPANDPLLLVELGQHEAALALYRARPSDDPQCAEARFDAIGNELVEQKNDYERAARVFRLEAALHPESANANAGLALALLLSGRHAEAAPFVAKARARAGKDGEHSEVERIYFGIRMNRIDRLDRLDRRITP